MKILAIDSSSIAGSVALLEDGEIKYEDISHDKRTHSETLLPMIAKLKECRNRRVEREKAKLLQR